MPVDEALAACRSAAATPTARYAEFWTIDRHCRSEGRARIPRVFACKSAIEQDRVRIARRDQRSAAQSAYGACVASRSAGRAVLRDIGRGPTSSARAASGHSASASVSATVRPQSDAFPNRFALFEERARAFLKVLRVDERAELERFEFQRIVDGKMRAVVDRALASRQLRAAPSRQWRCRCAWLR